MLLPTAMNGKIPLGLLSVLPGFNGDGTPHRADLLCVASFERLARDYAAALGVPLLPTAGFSCYRSLSDQAYMRAQGLTTVPVGQSIHGEALALDFAGVPFRSAGHNWLKTNAGRYGFYQPVWAQQTGSLPEPWHWEYDRTRDTQPGPTTPPQEDDMTPDQAAQLDFVYRQSASTYALLEETPSRTGQTVAMQPVSRVVGHPSTWKQDTVDGTTAALLAVQKLDQVLARLAALEAKLP